MKYQILTFVFLSIMPLRAANISALLQANGSGKKTVMYSATSSSAGALGSSNCTGFTTASSSVNCSYGRDSSISATMLFESDAACNVSRNIMCLCEK